MSTTTTLLTIRLLHNASIPGARWCEPVGWEPANVIEGSELDDGAWWDADEQTAGLVWFGEVDAYGSGDVVEVTADDLRVASCGDCRVIGEVQIG
jgi:hypothetical protein